MNDEEYIAHRKKWNKLEKENLESRRKPRLVTTPDKIIRNGETLRFLKDERNRWKVHPEHDEFNNGDYGDL